MRVAARLVVLAFRIFLVSAIISMSEVGQLTARNETLSNGKSLSIPFKRYGISIGNSNEFNGIRINYADAYVYRVNGLNFTLWYKNLPGKEESNRHNQIKLIKGLYEAPNKSAVVNGVTAGVVPVAGTMQLLNFGFLGLFADNSLNGVSVGGLYSIGNHINGVCVGGLTSMAPKSINGLAFGTLAVYSADITGIPVSPLVVSATNKIRGLTVAGIYAGGDSESTNVKIEGITIAGLYIKGGVINGIPVSPGLINCNNNLSGLALSVISLKSGVLNGLGVSCIVNTNKTNGVSIALFNRTKELHGLQLGLLNYAGNNRKGLRFLPLINLHLLKQE
jgi:hypothetical protein